MLLRWFGDKSWLPVLLFTTAFSGHLNCCQSFKRWQQVVDWQPAARGAAWGGHLECLKLALEKGARVESDLLCDAAAGGNLDILAYLDEAGCTWTGEEAVFAVEAGDPEVLAFCLRHAQPQDAIDWHCAMLCAMRAKSLECVQLLYDYGYEQHRSREPREHPALLAVQDGNVACLRLAVQRSGQPDHEPWPTEVAARSGEDMLRCVWEMGGRISKDTALEGIHASQVGALRFAFQVGAPCTMEMIRAAIAANSPECLRCVCEQVRVVGLPQGYDKPATGYWNVPRDLDPAIVQYIANDVDPLLSHPVMVATAEGYAFKARTTTWDHTSCGGEDGIVGIAWRTALLLARWFGREPMPEHLHRLVAVRRERAAALAGAFYMAGKLAREETPSPSLPLWRALAALPSELRERIAFQAHLVAPLQEAHCRTSALGPAARLQPFPA
eukprot:jgi/Botrbrau1/20144/Bobra.0173s0046.1